MGEEAAVERYEPGPAFDEVKEEAMLDMSPTDSKEFWLIQWIKDKDLDLSDFHGKEFSLKLHKDGNLSRLESSSGKSYDLVSFAYQQPNAAVFLPSGSETKVVGKISHRVCLVRHQEPEELDKPIFGSLAPISKKSAEREGSGYSAPGIGGSDMQNAMSTQSVGQEIQSGEPGPSVPKISPVTCYKTNDSDAGSPRKALAKKKKASARKEAAKKRKHSRLIATHQGSELTSEHNKRKDESNVGHSDVSGQTSEGLDARAAQSNTITEMPQTTPEKPRKKKVKIAEL